MLQDYATTLSDYQAHVAIQDNMVVGTILLQITDEGFCVDSVAVRPAVKGLGVGGASAGIRFNPFSNT